MFNLETAGKVACANICVCGLLEELKINYDVPVLIYQDNKSTITMAQSGRGNFKRTKHIANRYFWVKQFIDSGEIKLVYIPTEQMIADILTKPITGSKFYNMVKIIFNE